MRDVGQRWWWVSDALLLRCVCVWCDARRWWESEGRRERPVNDLWQFGDKMLLPIVGYSERQAMVAFFLLYRGTNIKMSGLRSLGIDSVQIPPYLPNDVLYSEDLFSFPLTWRTLRSVLARCTPFVPFVFGDVRNVEMSAMTSPCPMM